jgi:hypothetical protein
MLGSFSGPELLPVPASGERNAMSTTQLRKSDI